MIVILTEKPSAARNFANALGGREGCYKGEQYKIVNSIGHIFEFCDPKDQVSGEKSDIYRIWDIENMPWDPNDFSWKKRKCKTRGIDGTLREIKAALSDASEVVIGTDDDPSGEGSLLAWEILIALKWQGKTSRMFFPDESPVNIQAAFSKRVPLSSDPLKDGDYVKADTRSKWDYLSMQFTRIATCIAGECGYRRILRNGRLKSVMVYMVGSQEDLIANYIKNPFYEIRFRDENGNSYAVDKEAAVRVADKGVLDLSAFRASEVIVDRQEIKKTVPGKLLDMAGLSAILAANGMKPEKCLQVYQKLYENQITSYPRTEDKKITPEQFYELLPFVDKIAEVVGVDKSLLTHRTPRDTHVARDAGSHGANRPGINVPRSLSELEQKFGEDAPKIYELVAKNYLATLAEDYEYLREKGHLTKYPDFKATVNIPRKLGFKKIFDATDEEDIVNENHSLGKIAEPYIYEGVNKKPEKPSIKWLIKKLERFNVGTGATRTSTVADVTNIKDPRVLMSEKRGALSLTENGKMAYCLLQGCKISSVEITEALFDTMGKIGRFEESPERILTEIADLVTHDIDAMQNNKTEFLKKFGRGSETSGPEKKYTGVFTPTGREVSFKKSWGGHEFTPQELSNLLEGKTITITCIGKDSTTYEVTGHLGEGEYMKRKYWGFIKDENNAAAEEKYTGVYTNGKKPKTVTFKRVWGGHRFTDEEIKALLAGYELTINYTKRNGEPGTATGSLRESKYKGHKYWGFKIKRNNKIN